MAEQVVELRPNLQDPLWSVLCHDLVRHLADEGLPVWRRDAGFVCNFLTENPISHVLLLTYVVISPTSEHGLPQT